MSFSAKDLAAFYYQFGTMIESGVPILRALETLKRGAPGPIRPAVRRISELVNGGDPFHEAISRFPRWFAPLDQHTISISERSGALETGLHSLSQYYERQASARSRIISACTLPGLIMIAAVFVSKFPALVLGTVGSRDYTGFDYVRDTVGLLALLALAGFVAACIVRSALSMPGLSLRLDRMIRYLPLLGKLRFEYALSRWISSIRLMLNAGYGILQALEQSSRSVSSPILADAYERVRPLIHGHLEVSAALEQAKVFPDELIQFWSTGEQSGRLDEMLVRLSSYYEERWRHHLDVLAAWLPRIVYGLVCIYVIFQMAGLLRPLMGAYGEALQP